jgi:hypothetical protein
MDFLILGIVSIKFLVITLAAFLLTVFVFYPFIEWIKHLRG